MKDLVTIYNDELRCGTYLLAEGFNRKHSEILKLCRKYKNEMMEFENNKGVRNTFIINKISSNKPGQPVKEYLLNEGQTIFLGTLFRAKTGEDNVLRFKVKIAKDFIRQKKTINALLFQRQTPDWIKKRADGKIARKEETDVIKDFVEYAKAQGSTNPSNYYQVFTKLCNEQMFLCSGNFKNKREVMTASQLGDVKFADTIVLKWIIKGINKSLPYKDIYKLVKEKIIVFAEIYGKSEIISKRIEKQEQLYLFGEG